MLRDAINKELDKLADDILHTEKSHFAAADRWAKNHNFVGGVTTVFAAVSATTTVAVHLPWLSGFLALIAAVAAALQTFLRFGDSRDKALSAGRDLGALRVRIRQVRNLRVAYATDDELKELVPVVAELAAEKAEIDRRSPISTPRDYKKGKLLIEGKEFE